MDYIVVWDGAHRGVDADLLCVHPARVRDVPEATPASRVSVEDDCRDWAVIHARLMMLLEAKTSWRIKDLQIEMGFDGRSRVIHGLVQRLRRHQLVRTVEYGTIALVRRQTGAAA